MCATRTLANVKTVLRNTKGQERLSSLTMMNIRNDMPVDLMILLTDLNWCAIEGLLCNLIIYMQYLNFIIRI